MEVKLILTELRLFKLTNLWQLFTLWGRQFVKSTSSTVYSGYFLNKAYILWTYTMKICMWSFGEIQVKFGRKIPAF